MKFKVGDYVKWPRSLAMREGWRSTAALGSSGDRSPGSGMFNGYCGIIVRTIGKECYEITAAHGGLVIFHEHWLSHQTHDDRLRVSGNEVSSR